MNALADPSRRDNKHFLELARAEILDAELSGSDVLISAEAAYRYICSEVGRQFLQNLYSFTSGCKVTPLLVFRRQDEFAKSLYAEWVKNWGEVRSFREFRECKRSWFMYADTAKQVHEAFGGMRILWFDDIKGPDIVTKFMYRALGVNFGTESIHERQSLPGVAILCMLRLNRNDRGDEVQSFARWFRDVALGVVSDLPSEVIWGSYREREEFQNQFFTQNKELAEIGDLHFSRFPRLCRGDVDYGYATDEILADILREFEVSKTQ